MRLEQVVVAVAVVENSYFKKWENNFTWWRVEGVTVVYRVLEDYI